MKRSGLLALVAALAAAVVFAPASAFAAQPASPAEGYPGVSHHVMDGGLEVFTVSNRAVPLVTVCVVFRGGASAQTPETAGLFHLYEHMLFAGNDLYASKEAFTAAMKAMGTANWNGATGSEYINYYITVPSDRLEDGIRFWAAAVRSPTFDPEVLENEKKVVLEEIRGYHADPGTVAHNALESRMYPEFPWRKNIDGPERNIERATVADMRALQASFYIPANAALLVGGDADPDEVNALAKKHFGGWKGGPAPTYAEPPHGPVPEGIRLIAPDASFYRGLAQAQFRWRGPDAMRQTADTYAADVLLYLASSPVGRFKRALMEKVPGLYDPEYIDLMYPTSRDGGAFLFNTYMTVAKLEVEGPVLDRTEALRAAVIAELAQMAQDPAGYFGEAELEKAKTKLIDQNLFASEAADGFVTNILTFWWSVATTDYFFGYESACGAVGWDDIASLVRRYFLGTPAATLVRIRESTAASDTEMEARTAALGYVKAGPENAFWWQR